MASHPGTVTDVSLGVWSCDAREGSGGWLVSRFINDLAGWAHGEQKPLFSQSSF